MKRANFYEQNLALFILSSVQKSKIKQICVFGNQFSEKFGTESPTCGFPLILLALPGFVH